MGKTSEAAAEQKQTWWDRPGRGRSQCRKCKKYIGTARHVCPNCKTEVRKSGKGVPPSSHMLEAMQFANQLRQFVNGQKGKSESERLKATDELIDQVGGFLAKAGGVADLKQACRLALGRQLEAEQAT